MTDETALLKAAKKLDQEALAAIFDTYASAIYRYSLRLCHDPIQADHIVGDVFAQLLEKLAAGQGPLTNLKSYLYQIAYHLIVDRPRHNHRFAPLQSLSAGQDKSAGLSFSLGETASTVSKTIHNVEVIQNRGITKLRNCLGFQAGSSQKELAYSHTSGRRST